MYCRILNRFVDNFCNNCVWRHYVNICSFNEINVHENEFKSSSWQYITLFTSKRRINNRSNSETFVNVFDYLSTRRAELRFIIISSRMLAFDATSSTFAIKQNDVLFVFFDNVKNAQKEKNTFYDAIKSFVQDIIIISSNTKLIDVDDSENALIMSNFKAFSALFPVRTTISDSIFNFFLILNRLHAYQYIQWKNSRKKYFDVEWKKIRRWKIDYRHHQSRQ